MKKKLTAVLAVLMLFAVVFSGSVTAHARSASEDGLYVWLYDAYKKEYKTYFPLKISNREAYYSFARYQLQNTAGKVLATWKDVPIHSHQDMEQRPWCDMRKIPAGNCYFHVYIQQPRNKEKWFHWQKKVYNNTGGIQLKQAALRRTDSGTLVPKISMNYQNIQGKYIYLEIRDIYDNTIYKTKSSKSMKSKEGSYWFSWGGQVGDTLYPSGYYKVRVAFSGGKWVEREMYLDFSRAY